MRHFTFIKSPLLAFVLISIAAPCVAEGLIIKDAPDWVNDITAYKKEQSLRLFQGVSSAPRMNNPQLQNAIADKRARRELHRIFTAYTDALSNDYQAAGNKAPSAEQLINLVQAVLPDAKIVARWRDKRTGLLFFHIQLNLAAVEKIVADSQGIDPPLKRYLQKNGKAIFDRLSEGKYRKAATASQPLEIARQAGCLACHKIQGKLIGPAFSWISYKYKDDKKNGKSAIVHTIINGSKNKWAMVWGIAMPPMNKKTTAAQRTELAEYILSLNPVAPPR
jgi:cytochrome c551/c552